MNWMLCVFRCLVRARLDDFLPLRAVPRVGLIVGQRFDGNVRPKALQSSGNAFDNGLKVSFFFFLRHRGASKQSALHLVP
jgi:hypothetical protein